MRPRAAQEHGLPECGTSQLLQATFGIDLLVVRPGYPGHSLRLLLSEGDPRVGPVVGSGLYVRPPPQEQVCAW